MRYRMQHSTLSLEKELLVKEVALDNVRGLLLNTFSSTEIPFAMIGSRERGTPPMDIMDKYRDLFDALEEHCKKYYDHKDKTVQNTFSGVRRFIRWLDESNIRVSEITSEVVMDFRYKSVSSDQKLKPNSKRTIMKSVRVFASYLHKNNIAAIHPDEVKLFKEVNTKKDLPTAEELERLKSMIDTTTDIGVRDMFIIEAFYSTGARISEFLNLNIYEVNMSAQEAIIMAEKGSQIIRKLYFSPEAIHWLKRYLKTRDDNNTKLILIGDKAIRQRIHVYRKKAGIRKTIHPHLLRHTIITDYLKAKRKDPLKFKYAQKLAGHKDVKTTINIYTHLLDEEIKDSHTEFFEDRRMKHSKEED